MEGPALKAWEGEVGVGQRSGIPHLTPALSAPGSGEGVSDGAPSNRSSAQFQAHLQSPSTALLTMFFMISLVPP